MVYLLINRDTLKYLKFYTEEDLEASTESDVFKAGAVVCYPIDEASFKGDEKALNNYIISVIIRTGNKTRRDRFKEKNRNFKYKKYVCMGCNEITTEPTFMFDEHYAYCRECSPYELTPEGIISFFKRVIFPQREK